MGYINKEYLEIQFKNFATRIANVFAKKSEIPTVNDATLTIKQDGKTIGSFSANSASDVEVVIADTSPSVTVDQTYNPTSANPQSGTAVKEAISALPTPMQFKGTLGESGTITTLPAASASEGFVYKVITEGTYGNKHAEVGDTFVSNGTEWIIIPSGDEPDGTVTNIAIEPNGGIGVTGSPITTSGTIKISNTGVRSISVDSKGTVSVNTNGTSANILQIESSNIDFSTYFS